MKSLIIFIILITCQLSFANSKGGKKKLVSVGLMALNSSVSQGGTGPSGSSVLTRSEFVYGWQHWGLGAIFDYDLHGSNEKDSAYGIKVEGYLSDFFLEIGYLISAKRAYTDRTIAEETGTGTVLGFGARFPLGRGTSKTFFHASYKMKTQTLTQQDGVSLSEPITQTYGYPVFGFGWEF
ncbi:MAG: hypothetical protein K0R29_1199 [Pseudobdellovibrio sp.]|jgi:hypothetical protein|nr:hypothetical protein [Pseudobdellovibrio sp.]